MHGGRYGHLHHRIHQAFNATALARRPARVHDDFGVDAGKDDEADDPLGVPEDTPAEEDGIKVDRCTSGLTVLAELAIVHLDARRVLEHVYIGRLGADEELCLRRKARVPDVRELWYRLPHLEIRFAVQILRLEIAHVLLL